MSETRYVVVVKDSWTETPQAVFDSAEEAERYGQACEEQFAEFPVELHLAARVASATLPEPQAVRVIARTLLQRDLVWEESSITLTTDTEVWLFRRLMESCGIASREDCGALLFDAETGRTLETWGSRDLIAKATPTEAPTEARRARGCETIADLMLLGQFGEGAVA